MQSILKTIFPNFCLTCDAIVEESGALCGKCWQGTPFISGTICDTCGAPLPSGDEMEALHCDDCLLTARPWEQGRAAMLYSANARRLVLSMKHGDRPELARPAARWLYRAMKDITRPDAVLVPVPAHRSRLWARRYNQAALLAQEIARIGGMITKPEALIRHQNTPTQEGRTRDARFANLDGAIQPNPRLAQALAGRDVIIVDDVMTSGATLAATAEACRVAGAARISVAVLARVAKDA